jgi:hypothetical protein
MKTLNYKYANGITGIDVITVYDDNSILCELDVFADSPYNPPEEIQNWLDNNGYEDEEFEFSEIK